MSRFLGRQNKGPGGQVTKWNESATPAEYEEQMDKAMALGVHTCEMCHRSGLTARQMTSIFFYSLGGIQKVDEVVFQRNAITFWCLDCAKAMNEKISGARAGAGQQKKLEHK